MGKFVFGAIGVLVVFGLVFTAGLLVGGGFGTGTAKDEQAAHIKTCLPIRTDAELAACLARDDSR